MLRRTTMVAIGIACSCAGSNGVPQPREDAPAAPRQPGASGLRVGNQAAGVEEQPDYDRAALEIREKVAGRLPDPLPSPKAACVAMYDAAIAAYTQAESAAAPPVKLLQLTKGDGIEACQADTSPAAASCVAVLARVDGGEFPWLLDQCSRAFPNG